MRQPKYQVLQSENHHTDDDFFDDVLGMFPDASGYAPKAGRCGKYVYESENWGDFISHSDNYYPPQGDLALIQTAIREIDKWGVPLGTPYIDLGAGGAASFKRYALPVMKGLESTQYTGVDFAENALREIQALKPELAEHTEIKTEKMDLFFPTNKVIAKTEPALGVMNGLTLGNMDGSLSDQNVDVNLATALKYLSQLCGHGWLLLTIDTNQDEASLRKAYVNPSNSHLCLSILSRVARELPVKNFDPTSFRYDVEFHPDLHLLANLAVATKTQDFKLGPYPIHVQEGQKIHLSNSYKFNRKFFESSCRIANLSTVKYWKHETGMMLYLLRDNLCPVPLMYPTKKTHAHIPLQKLEYIS